MGGDSLLAEKKVPPIKALEAAFLAVSIIGTVAYVLIEISEFMESSFHILEHSTSENAHELKVHPGYFLGAMMSFPILGAGSLGLVIPLAVYVADHAAFNDLHVIRPDHFGKLLSRVYRSWAATNGKMATKDL